MAVIKKSLLSSSNTVTNAPIKSAAPTGTLASAKMVPAVRFAPAKSKLAPAKSKLAPAKSKLAPAKSKLAPAKSKLAPAKSKLAPAKSKLAPMVRF